MKVNKIKNNYYNLTVINTKKFKKNIIKFQFITKSLKEESSIRYLLSLIILKSTKNCLKERDILIKKEELYNLTCSSTVKISGRFSILSLEFSFLDEIYSEKGMFNETLNFILNFINKPNINNNKFDEKLFNQVIKEASDDINSYKEDPDHVASQSLYEAMSECSELSHVNYGYLSDLENITNEELVSYFYKVINTESLHIFFVGNINFLELNSVLESNLSFRTNDKISMKPIKHNDLKETPLYKKKTFKTNQSILKIGFKLSDLTKEEKEFVIPFYNNILGGSPESKLFKNVREKHSLCYTIRSTYYQAKSILVISAGINAKDYKQTLELIMKEVFHMEKGEFTLEDILSTKKQLINEYDEQNDNAYQILSSYILNTYYGFSLPSKAIKSLNNIKKDMIKSVSKKIKLDTIFLLEGDLNAED